MSNYEYLVSAISWSVLGYVWGYCSRRMDLNLMIRRDRFRG